MSIYSTNRSGSVNVSSLVANESYRSSDLNRIMYESELNDMAIFEAIVINDLGEMKALSEGTMLLSEAEEATKETKKNLIVRIRELLAKFWQKIKGAYKDIRRKFLAYVLKDSRQVYEEFKIVSARKKAKNKDFVYDVNPITLYETDGFLTALKTIDLKKIKGKVSEAQTSVEGAINVLNMTFDMSIDNISKFAEEANKKFSIEKKIENEDDMNDIANRIKKLENDNNFILDIESSFEAIINDLDIALKKAESGNDTVFDNDTALITRTVSAVESVITVSLKVARLMLNSNAKTVTNTLRKLLRDMKDSYGAADVAAAKAINDAADLVDNYDADNALSDSPVESEMSPEVKNTIDEILKSNV